MFSAQHSDCLCPTTVGSEDAVLPARCSCIPSQLAPLDAAASASCSQLIIPPHIELSLRHMQAFSPSPTPLYTKAVSCTVEAVETSTLPLMLVSIRVPPIQACTVVVLLSANVVGVVSVSALVVRQR